MNKKNFVCKRCGECCRHYVLLNAQDIKRLKKSGHADSIISSRFDRRRKCLKMVGNDCVFLGYNGNVTFCSIYSLRPSVCRTYPFFKENIKSCTPKLWSDIIH